MTNLDKRIDEAHKSGKPTPLPWRPVEDAQGICGLMHPTKEGVAVAWFSTCHSPSNGYVGDDTLELGRPEREANARLIMRSAWLLKQIIESLPAKRDWLDPVIEREARDLLGMMK